MNYLDTWGWLEYFFEGPKISFFAEPVEETADLIVSFICLWTQDDHFLRLPGVKFPGKG